MGNKEVRLLAVTLLSMGKTFYFRVGNEDYRKGDLVLCETTRGIEIGKVSSDPIEKAQFSPEEYPPVLRKGDETDYRIHQQNLVKGEQAIRIAQEKADRLNLDMKVIAAEYLFDCTKVIIYYLAESRVDFRELLKDLASQLRCRIELRQIGSRDKAKMIGGIGVCGLKLCCATFLNEFDGITITMAKNQMLALNIPKLSGQCGKLMCCLKYENDTYTDLQKDLPRIGTKVSYEGLIYRIASINVITRVVRLENKNSAVNVDYDAIKDAIVSKETPLSGGKGH